MVIESEGQTYVIPLSEICYFQAQGNYVLFVGERHRLLVRRSFSSVTQGLPEAFFVRTHRSFIVRKALIRGLYRTDSGSSKAELEDGTQIPVSRGRFNSLKAQLAAMA